MSQIVASFLSNLKTSWTNLIVSKMILNYPKRILVLSRCIPDRLIVSILESNLNRVFNLARSRFSKKLTRGGKAEKAYCCLNSVCSSPKSPFLERSFLPVRSIQETILYKAGPYLTVLERYIAIFFFFFFSPKVNFIIIFLISLTEKNTVKSRQRKINLNFPTPRTFLYFFFSLLPPPAFLLWQYF